MADLTTLIHSEIAARHSDWIGYSSRAFDDVDWTPTAGFEPCENCGTRVSLWRHKDGSRALFHVGKIVRSTGNCRLHQHTPSRCRRLRHAPAESGD